MRLQKKAIELKEKLVILLYREVDLRIENNMEFVYEIFKNILKKSNPNVTGKTKLEIYRNYDPKISFPIYLDEDDFSNLCKEQNLNEEEMKQKLIIPTMTSMSIFNDKIFMNYIYPEFVWEINRIKNNHNFDLKTKHWDSLMLYEVGLG